MCPFPSGRGRVQCRRCRCTPPPRLHLQDGLLLALLAPPDCHAVVEPLPLQRDADDALQGRGELQSTGGVPRLWPAQRTCRQRARYRHQQVQPSEQPPGTADPTSASYTCSPLDHHSTCLQARHGLPPVKLVGGRLQRVHAVEHGGGAPLGLGIPAGGSRGRAVAELCVQRRRQTMSGIARIHASMRAQQSGDRCISSEFSASHQRGVCRGQD